MRTIPRRIVTGIRAGKSFIEADSLVDNVSEHYPNLVISDIWQTSQMPASFEKEHSI